MYYWDISIIAQSYYMVNY